MTSGIATRELTTFIWRSFVAGSAIWLLSLLVPTPARYWMWVGALGLEFAAPLIGTRKATDSRAHEEHFRERYALFTIIVFGESFVKTLTESADVGISVQSEVFGGLMFVAGIALWWTYFDDVADSTIRPDSPNRLLPWVYSHLPLAMALTGLGVAGKKVIVVEAFGGEIKESYLWLLVGSIALALLATAVLDMVTVSPHFAVGLRLRVLPRLVASALLLAVPVVFGSSRALLVVAVISLITVAQIAVEVVVASKAERRLDESVSQQLSDLDATCPRLDEVGSIQPRSEGCPDCDAKGAVPVQLRVCLQCGVVGCCDDTPGQHARAHYHQTGHTLIATLESGDTWAYCYEHDAVKQDWGTTVGSS